MSSISSHAHDHADPLAVEGPYLKKAYVWFVVVAVIASVMTWKFSQIDRRFYDSEGKYLDYNEYRENRTAATSLPSERIDERRVHSLTSNAHHAEGAAH